MTEVYIIVNEMQYIENAEFVSGIESVWGSESAAKMELARLALILNAEYSEGDTVFFESEVGPNVEYSEYRIDVWEVK